MTDQYRILEGSAGWIDRSGRGRLRIEGPDAVPFLHALVTNDIQRLAPGDGAHAAYLTPQGRMIADLALYHRGEFLLAAVAPGAAAPLAEKLDQVIFAERVTVADVSATSTELFVTGGAASDVLGRAFGVGSREISALSELAQRDVPGGFVARSGDAPLDAFTVVVFAAAHRDLMARLEAAGAQPMTEQLGDALRIAAGRPAFGADMTAETIPLEAGLLDRAISTTKGCYVGQESIIRILHRGAGRVAKRLVTLRWDATATRVPPAPGTTLLVEGRSVGQLTSAAGALTGDGQIGLGYVARDLAVPGGSLMVGEAGPVAEITGFAR
jgi:hypothetical protein